MKWIKASERLPELKGIANSVIIRGENMPPDKFGHSISGKFLAMGYINYDTEYPKFYFNIGHQSFLSNETIEWLDESDCPSHTEEPLRAFKVWDNVNNREATVPVYIDHEGNVYADQDPYGVNISGKRTIAPSDKYSIIPSPVNDTPVVKGGKEEYEKAAKEKYPDFKFDGTMGPVSRQKSQDLVERDRKAFVAGAQYASSVQGCVGKIKQAKIDLIWTMIEGWQDSRDNDTDIKVPKFSYQDIELDLYEWLWLEKVDPKGNPSPHHLNK